MEEKTCPLFDCLISTIFQILFVVSSLGLYTFDKGRKSLYMLNKLPRFRIFSGTEYSHIFTSAFLFKSMLRRVINYIFVCVCEMFSINSPLCIVSQVSWLTKHSLIGHGSSCIIKLLFISLSPIQ